MQNAVSVVMPVYNAAKYLKESIDSALAQVDVAVQVVAVDDGSSDNSLEILASYGDRVTALSQKNAGPAAARNAALAQAIHPWVAFLDADDLWEPTKLKIQLESAAATNAVVVYTNSVNFGDVERVGDLRLPPDRMPAGDVFEALLMDNFITMSSVMVKRQALADVGGFDAAFRGTEDWNLWLRLAAESAVFTPVPEPLVKYRWMSTSLSKNHATMKQMREATLLAALQTPKGQSVHWKLRRQALANVRQCSAWFVAEQSKSRAAMWYLQSLCAWPCSVTAWKGLVKSCLGRT